MSDTNTLPILSKLTPERVSETMSYLQRGNEAALKVLATIDKIETEEQAAEVMAKLAKVKAVYDKMLAKRMEVTDVLREVADQFMQYERMIDYNSKKPNNYTQGRAKLEAYNQTKLNVANAAKQVAENQKAIDQYKADLKASVLRELTGMLSGQHKNVVQGMVSWEKGLTLENLKAKIEGLKGMPIQLKRDAYEACFHMPVNPQIILNYADTLTFITGLKTEYTYESFNEKYQVLISPIKNEYVAKEPKIREALEKVNTDATAAAERQQQLDATAQASLKAISDNQIVEEQKIEDSKGMDHMEAEFREQGITQDLPSGPSMKVVRLGEQPVKQFTSVVAHSMSHPEFPDYHKKNGEEYIDAIGWWLKFFAANCDTKVVEGLEVEVKAKTIVKKG